MTAAHAAGRELLGRVWTDLGGGPSDVGAAPDAAHAVPLASRTATSALAWASVGAASIAAASLAGRSPVALDADRIAVAYASERYFRLDGGTLSAWAPLSGFFRTSDGWVRTHGNYPHHAAALRRALGLAADAGAEEAASALRGMPAGVAAQAVTAAGGLCVGVAHENRVADDELRATPLVAMSAIASPTSPPREAGAPDAPLRGIRVLDLTRVIAGPVATRTLALLGADVLRIDPRDLPEPEWHHLDSGHGKRSTLLDLAAQDDRRVFDRLLSSADVVVTGYRTAALDRLGLSPEALIARRPGLVVARLTAWGADGAAADRRGFDSLVQAASGIAWIESADGSRPGALPAQALDHSAGYLLAAGVVRALHRARAEGGSWVIDVSLRRVAAELLGMPRTDEPDPVGSLPAAASHVQEFAVEELRVTTAAPAIAYAGGPEAFAPPRRWGRDAPEWRATDGR
jgi:hypothetical protein